MFWPSAYASSETNPLAELSETDRDFTSRLGDGA